MLSDSERSQLHQISAALHGEDPALARLLTGPRRRPPPLLWVAGWALPLVGLAAATSPLVVATLIAVAIVAAPLLLTGWWLRDNPRTARRPGDHRRPRDGRPGES